MHYPQRIFLASLLSLFPTLGCGDDASGGEPVGRGTPGAPAGGGAPAAPAEGEPAGEAGAEPEPEPDKRPKAVLTREDFALETRDPYQNFLGTQVVELEPDRPRAQRDVKMSEYNFEDLKLIAIVNSGRNIVPRALFLASDGKSKPIHQGEYFSRAEVLLAAVNRDYVEVEVVDEDLASSLNMTRGERRAIYLKNE